MQPQYVELLRMYAGCSEALASQNCRSEIDTYQFGLGSPNVHSRNTPVSLTLETGRTRHIAVWRPIVSNRRLRCPRASNSWQYSAWLPLFPPAQAGRQKKNTLLPSPSRLSPYIQANTSNRLSGQARAPVPNPIPVAATISAIGSTARQQEGL